jgi:copper chaperone CopZ
MICSKGDGMPRHRTESNQLLDGKLRIKVPEVKGSSEIARDLESQVTKLHGVAHVKANLLTGSVLVLFDSQVISYYEVFAVLQDFTYFL